LGGSRLADIQNRRTNMNKKVKITVLCLIAMLCIMLSGCGDDKISNQQGLATRFLDTGDMYYIAAEGYRVVVDTKTDLVYLVSDYNGGFNEFIGADKTQMTLSEYNATK
jgi:hypothetical protein